MPEKLPSVITYLRAISSLLVAHTQHMHAQMPKHHTMKYKQNIYY